MCIRRLNCPPELAPEVDLPTGREPHHQLLVGKVVTEGCLGGPVADPGGRKGAGDELALRKKTAHCYAELGTGFKNSDAGNSETQVLPEGRVNKPIQEGVIEFPPPCPVLV